MASAGWTPEHDTALAEIKKESTDLVEIRRVLDNIKVKLFPLLYKFAFNQSM